MGAFDNIQLLLPCENYMPDTIILCHIAFFKAMLRGK
jgi:hypothetical protein